MKKKWLLLGFAGLIAGGYGLRRQLLARLLGLPPVRYRVRVQRAVPVPMPDGVRLIADHYQPVAAEPLPAMLIRTPYNRGNFNTFVAQRFAERGYHVISQDTRGRFASAGEFEPFVNEQADGVATLAWMAEQPWCNGRIATWGQSYVGFVQWAAAVANPPALRAMVPNITEASLSVGRSDDPTLDGMLRWLIVLDAMERNVTGAPFWQRARRLFDMSVQDPLVAQGASRLPLRDADEAIFGEQIPYFQQWVAHDDPNSAYWQQIDYNVQAGEVEAPVHMIGGWYDLFIEGTLQNYAALRANGRSPFLTIGPWIHMDFASQMEALRQGVAWFDFHLKGKRQALQRQPVRIYVMGAEEWREMASWPPPATETPYYLQEGGLLAPSLPGVESAPDRYVYDPADPTPHVGGALLSPHAGPQDNREREARADVLTYTTPPLEQDLEVIGPVELVLYAQSDRVHSDFFVCLCDVQPDGRSINICDGIVRVQPGVGTRREDGTLRLVIRMAATANRFRQGHRLRLQVSGGAFPRYNRNPGTGELPWTAVELVSASHTIYHDAQRPSALMLPVIVS